MTNSMDVIWVRWGASTKGTNDTKTKIKKSAKAKTVPITEFLKTDPEKLYKKERRIQKALQQIYDLNGKEPPLFQKFPDFRSGKNPLTIDITTAEKDNGILAAFIPAENEIIFNHACNKEIPLVGTLAHELKHAEQCDKEVYQSEIRLKDAYKWQQMAFLQEAQAYAFGGRVCYEILKKNNEVETKLYEEIAPKYTDASGRKDFKKIEEEMIAVLLDKLYSGWNNYRTDYELEMPIDDKDKGLDHIPQAFHLSQNLLAKVKEAPRKATSNRGKLIQAEKNRDRDEYIRLLKTGISRKDEEGVEGERLINNLKSILLSDAETGCYSMTKEETVFVLSYSQDADSLAKVIEAIRRKKSFSSMITTALCNRMEDSSDSFNLFVSLIKDKNGRLPVSGGDFVKRSQYGTNELVYSWVNKENLSTFMNLKGKDGGGLIDKENFMSVFTDCVVREKDPDKIQDIFDSIKDEKGNFPCSRKIFDDFMDENELLSGLKEFFDYDEEKPAVLKKISIMAKWKDVDGLPIISSRNICAIFENIMDLKESDVCNDEDAALEFANAVKSCAVSQNPLKKIVSKHSVKNTEKISRIIKSKMGTIRDCR